MPRGLSWDALDFPGMGRTPAAGDDYRPSALAAWVAKAIQPRMDAGERVVLVGHSLGARVAGELAGKALAGLVLIAPLGSASYGFSDRLKWKAMSRRAVLRSVPQDSMRGALSHGFVSQGEASRGFVERALAARTGPQSATVTEAIERSVDGVLDAPPLSERLRGSRVPLLVVAGAEDPLAPPLEIAAIARARSDARVLTLSGQGHYPMLEDPVRVSRAIADFLA